MRLLSNYRAEYHLLALSIFLGATSAVAAPETGTRFDQAPKAVKPGQVEADNAGRKVMNQFARCYADIKRADAISTLAIPYLSPEQGEAVRKNAGGLSDCLGPNDIRLSFNAPTMVAGMAEELVFALYPKPDLLAIGAMSEEAMFASSTKPRNPAEDFAQCVVRRDPTNAYALIQTAVASKAEAAAVKTLVPQLGQCLIAGQDIKLNNATVRAIAAVGLYRILSGVASARVNN
jgi:hypothetical protein